MGLCCLEQPGGQCFSIQCTACTLLDSAGSPLRCPAAVPAPQVNRNGTGLKTMSQLNSAISNEEPDIISNRWGGHGSAALAGRAG